MPESKLLYGLTLRKRVRKDFDLVRVHVEAPQRRYGGQRVREGSQLVVGQEQSVEEFQVPDGGGQFYEKVALEGEVAKTLEFA